VKRDKSLPTSEASKPKNITSQQKLFHSFSAHIQTKQQQHTMDALQQ
jgi:hypothetical protein